MLIDDEEKELTEDDFPYTEESDEEQAKDDFTDDEALPEDEEESRALQNLPENETDYTEEDILNAEEPKKVEPEKNQGTFIDRNKIFISVLAISLGFIFFCTFILPEITKKKAKQDTSLEKAGSIWIPDEYEEDELTDDNPYQNGNSATDPYRDNPLLEADSERTSIESIDKTQGKAPVELPNNTAEGITGQNTSSYVVETNRNELQKAAFYIPLSETQQSISANRQNSYNSPYAQSGSYGNYGSSNGGAAYSGNAAMRTPYTPAALSSNMAAYLQSQSGSNYERQNNQSGRKDFYNEGRASDSGNYTWNSDFTLWKGTIIPAVLETGINTDNPGEVIATVTTNVYSSNNGQYILIPQGSRLFAEYNSSINYGQNRVQVAWNTLIRPDGLEINLGSVNGVDAKGYSGYTGWKTEHPFEYAKALGLIAMFSLIDTKANNLIDTQNNTYAQNVMSDVYSAQANLNGKIVDRALDIQPTIKIKSGKEIKLITNVSMEIPPLDPYPVEQKYVRK